MEVIDDKSRGLLILWHRPFKGWNKTCSEELCPDTGSSLNPEGPIPAQISQFTGHKVLTRVVGYTSFLNKLGICFTKLWKQWVNVEFNLQDIFGHFNETKRAFVLFVCFQKSACIYIQKLNSFLVLYREKSPNTDLIHGKTVVNKSCDTALLWSSFCTEYTVLTKMDLSYIKFSFHRHSHPNAVQSVPK